MYFATSQDLLFFILAVGVGVLTILFAWVLVYFILILKKAYNAVQDIERKIASVGTFANTIKEHLVNSSSSLRLLVDVAAKLIQLFVKRKSQRSSNPKTK